MGLTRPTVAQLNTIVVELSDPISVLNRGSTQANVDVGFVLNRDGGTSPNVALYWSETTKSITAAFTTSTGGVNANIAVTSYANLQVGNITSSGNISAQYITGSGQFLTGLPASYSNVNVKAYTESMGFQNYGNANVTAYTVTMGFTNFSNVNVAAYLSSGSASNLNTSGNILAAAGVFNALTVNGNLTSLSVAGTSTLYDKVTINNTTVTTSTTTGALTVAGGVGVAGTIAVGGTLLAGNASGTPGQVLSSTGAGLAWVTAGGGSANQPFSLSSNDFGSDLSGYTISEDEGDLTAGSTSYDLQYIATLGPITASLLELPSYTTTALPIGQNAGALAYDTSVQTVKFNNGTVWANIAPTYYQIDDLGLGFDGITTSFALTYNNGASISPTNPNQLKIRIGGVDISPFRYADDLVNLSEIARFDRGFRIVSGNITFASPPSPGMEFYGTVQANEEAEPPFVFKQTPFSAINIQYGY